LNDLVHAAAAAPAGAAADLSSRFADAKQERQNETYKGCEARATLGHQRRIHQPQRGCVNSHPRPHRLAKPFVGRRPLFSV